MRQGFNGWNKNFQHDDDKENVITTLRLNMLMVLVQKKELGVFIIFTICLSELYGHLSYEYDCEDTFYPYESSLFVTDEIPVSCYWKFETHVDETFKLTFQDLTVHRGGCNKHYVGVRDRQTRIKHCGQQDTPYTVETSSNVLTIDSWKNKQSTYLSFEAFLSRDIKSQLRVYETPMTWTEASSVCKDNGGYLAESFPVVSEKLKKLVHDKIDAESYSGVRTGHLSSPNRQGYWIGKSLTPWVMLRGCVRWDSNAGSVQAYEMSKYNQMSECATACSGFVYFALQKNSCRCIKEVKKTFRYVPYAKCNSRCPGKSSERCGGWNTYTLYEYYHGEILEADMTYNCVSQTGQPYKHKQSSCDTAFGFSCQFLNGSVITYNPNVPGRRKSLSWYKALDFCANLPESLGMAPLPKYHKPYFFESYWTAIIRTVDWNYDSVVQRRPEFSFVATLGRYDYYNEFMKNSSEKHGFICQNDLVACGHEEVADSGNITFPNHPPPYKERQMCEWHITVNTSKVIKLLIADMDVEESQDCIYDYLLVKENNKNIERLCGHISTKYLRTKNNTVTLVFRSDDTFNGKGFTIAWSAVDQISERSQATQRTKSSLSGGAVVGITVAVATLLVVLASFLACVAYKKRHARQNLQGREETSNAHNAIYAISSFNTSSFADEDTVAYQNVSQTRRKYNLKAEVSYANASDKRIETSPNVYQTIHKNGEVVSIDDGSKANLLFDSDSSNFGSIGKEKSWQRTKGYSTDTDVEIGGASGEGQPTFDISKINELGKESITVVSTKNIGQGDIKDEPVAYGQSKESSVTYTKIAMEKASPGTTEEEGYLNDGLDSNARMPHYEDIPELLEDARHSTRMDGPPKTSEKEEINSKTYLEL